MSKSNTTNPPVNSAKSMLKNTSSRLGLEALEPRILLDAAVVATGGEVVADVMFQSDVTAALSSLDFNIQIPNTRAPFDIQDGVNGLSGLDLAAIGYEKVAPGLDSTKISEPIVEIRDLGTIPWAATSPEKTIVFIDSAVENYQTLIADIPGDIEIVIIEANEDGLAKMADVLSQREGLEAVHILSHGDVGEMVLGTSTLTEQSITGEHASDLAIIRLTQRIC